MLTIRNLYKEIPAFLKNEFPNITIEPGKIGMVPSVLPCIWIYITPANKGAVNEQNHNFQKTAKVDLFCCSASTSDAVDTFLDSMELAEKAEEYIEEEIETFLDNSGLNGDRQNNSLSWPDVPIQPDDVYSDIAVVNLEFLLGYISSGKTQ